MPYRMTPSVRHRAIEVHYYYYLIVISKESVLCRSSINRMGVIHPRIPGRKKGTAHALYRRYIDIDSAEKNIYFILK